MPFPFAFAWHNAIRAVRHSHKISKAEKSSIEEKWTAYWRDKLGQPNRTPRQVMWAYCDELDIMTEHLITAMDCLLGRTIYLLPQGTPRRFQMPAPLPFRLQWLSPWAILDFARPAARMTSRLLLLWIPLLQNHLHQLLLFWTSLLPNLLPTSLWVLSLTPSSTTLLGLTHLQAPLSTKPKK